MGFHGFEMMISGFPWPWRMVHRENLNLKWMMIWGYPILGNPYLVFYSMNIVPYIFFWGGDGINASGFDGGYQKDPKMKVLYHILGHDFVGYSVPLHSLKKSAPSYGGYLKCMSAKWPFMAIYLLSFMNEH